MNMKKRKISGETVLLIIFGVPCLLVMLVWLLIYVSFFWYDYQNGITPSAAYLHRELGIARDEYTVLHEQDDHGGFHGDGMYFVVLDCSGKTEEMQKLTEDWRELPLPSNLHEKLYGGKFWDADPVENGLIEVANDGCYYFNNRHDDARHSWDTEIEGKFSYNFSIAVFNRENDTLCLMCVDT